MADLPKDQGRLIDHVKRVYSLVVGLALTEACKNLLHNEILDVHWASLWIFLTFFITVVPIFQGGDRFLDVTYFDRDLSPGATRAAFMWDVYMLLVTGLVFVGVAESVPALSGKIPDHTNFFYGLACMFGVDTFILVVGWFKSGKDDRSKIHKNYVVWIAMNGVMTGLSFFAGWMFAAMLGRSLTAFILLLAAATRTTIDYAIDKNFMFPQIQPKATIPPSVTTA
jgi:hypothetical protein